MMPVSPRMEAKFASLCRETGEAAADDFARTAPTPWGEKSIAAVSAELLAWIAMPYAKKPALFSSDFVERMQLAAVGAFEDRLRGIAMADPDLRGLS